MVDQHPRFHLDAVRWCTSLTALAGVEPADMIVHAVGNCTSDALDALRALGVTVRPVEEFDPRSPHCNKISGALRLAEDRLDGMAVLCDTDLAVLEDPRRLEVATGSVAAKVVDAPVPPLAVLEQIFAEAGVALPPVVDLPWGGGQTVSGNGNGGLYAIPADTLAAVVAGWEHWARWLLDRLHLLEAWAVHVDQVAMALALAAGGFGFEALDVRWNTPTHDLDRIPADAPVPAVLHYHQQVTVEGRIRVTGVPSIDGQIDRVNQAVAEAWPTSFPHETFRQWRSLTEPDPDPESGVASRGGPFRAQRDRLAALVEAVQPASVLEVGCGDGEATRGLQLSAYTGLDLSSEAVRRAQLGRPDGTYVVGALADRSLRAELTICLDGLTHQADLRAYRDLVARLWESAERVLVVSGYEEPTGAGSPRVHFHEPLSVSLRAVAAGAECYRLGHGDGITTFAVLRPPTERHPRDYASATLDPLLSDHPDPLELVALRLDAWRTLGFYPDHAPRLWEYPVVARLLRDHVEPGGRIVDVGAGVTPLAPYLTHRGYVLDTVDPSPLQRTWPPQPDWNEWDFLDYAVPGLARRSWNCTLDQLPDGPQFDAAYSVSVIEHLPADDRRALIGDIATRVRPGGLVVLTIDLVRDGDDLWNRNRGMEVEEPSRHGTISDVVAEVAARGLDPFRIERVRHWGDTSVDIGLLAMRRVTGPGPSALARTVRRGRALAERALALGGPGRRRIRGGRSAGLGGGGQG